MWISASSHHTAAVFRNKCGPKRGSFNRTAASKSPTSQAQQTFQAWSACWKVYRATLYMLRHPQPSPQPPKLVVTSAAMEEYYENIHKLNEEFPEAWHLIMQAEDRCRAEAFERYRRQLTKALSEGKLPMNIDFDVSAPWVSVFAYAARDIDYWSRQVIRPAHTFIARGSRNMSLQKAENINVSSGAQAALAAVGSPREVTVVKRKDSPGANSPAKASKKKQDATKASHPKKWGTHFITDHDGLEICFRYAKGKTGDCEDPCRDGRSHRCQHCLGGHTNDACPNHVKKTKGKGKGGKPAQ